LFLLHDPQRLVLKPGTLTMAYEPAQTQAMHPSAPEICVINLDRSPDRLAEFAEFNGHLGRIVRFSAVEGRALNIGALVRAGLVAPDVLSTFSPGAVGCAMSHVGLWKQAIATGAILTIAEDDAIFHRQFLQHAADVMGRLPADWDIILWGWNFDLFLSLEMLPGVSPCLAQFERIRSEAGIRVFQELTLWPQPLKLRWAFGTPCYSITPNGARRIISKCVPLRPSAIHFPEGLRAAPHLPYFRTVGIDVTLCSIYPDLNAFVSFPPVVVTKNDIARSTIGQTR
jgi:GR25 family glycosyltransferase involved in LPS biosynthesis